VKELIESVLAVYTRHLAPVSQLIHSKSGGIRQFAEAFQFRKT
jgi:hypothetical protein